jgi:2-polyprenyl-6-methoxyphenol hydroxylase-like FAD-dependent oxidoreductase
VLALPNVRLLERCHVLGLEADASGSQVCGVRLVNRQQGERPETLAADLVVDASGRGSRVGDWLQELGYATPEVEQVEVGMGYATRTYRREPSHLNGDLMVNVAPTLATKRACGMMAQEGERWIVTLAGYFGDYPPTDEVGYLAFAKSLPVPEVYEVIRNATPLSAIVAYKFPSNQRRRYERLQRFPAGLLVIGDAICSFTPIYGQGMSVAALEALQLRKALALGSEQLALRFFRQIAKVVDVPWGMAAGNDLRLAGTKQNISLGKRLLNSYLDELQIAARRDPEVAWAFLKVGSLLVPPSSLLHPSIVLRVARVALHRIYPIHRGTNPQKMVKVEM